MNLIFVDASYGGWNILNSDDTGTELELSYSLKCKSAPVLASHTPPELYFPHAQLV